MAYWALGRGSHEGATEDGSDRVSVASEAVSTSLGYSLPHWHWTERRSREAVGDPREQPTQGRWLRPRRGVPECAAC